MQNFEQEITNTLKIFLIIFDTRKVRLSIRGLTHNQWLTSIIYQYKYVQNVIYLQVIIGQYLNHK